MKILKVQEWIVRFDGSIKNNQKKIDANSHNKKGPK